MRNRRRTPPSRWRRLALGVATAAVLLGMVEVGLRIAGVVPAYQADLIGGWRMVPEIHGERLAGGDDTHPFIVTTNADGLRNGPARAKPPGLKRVALMGDSTMFGWGVDDGGTVADGVKAGLEGQPIEVINAGQPGYSTTQITLFFESVVRYYEPDLTVVFLPMHDHNKVLVSDREYLDGPAGPVAAARVLLATHSLLYQVIRQHLYPLSERPFLTPRDSDTEPRVYRVSEEERADNMARIATLAAGWGGKLALGHLPFAPDFELGPTWRPGQEWAAAYCKEHGLALLDLRQRVPRAPGMTLPWDNGHLTAAGNIAAGQAAAPLVAEAL